MRLERAPELALTWQAVAMGSISILDIVGGPWGSPKGRWRDQIRAEKRAFSSSGEDDG